MFSPEDILARMRKQPFVPLRIVTTAGDYDVHHPELVLVGRRYLEVGTASADNPETFDTISRVAICTLRRRAGLRDNTRSPFFDKLFRRASETAKRDLLRTPVL